MAKAQPIPGLRADMPYAAAAAATVRVRAAELTAAAEGVLDTDRAARVHGMRVATRRLRAVLEIYAPCFPADDFRAALRDVKRLADALGARRDPDVQLEGLERFAAALPAADGPGVRAFADAVRADQRAGNAVLADTLAHLDVAALHARLDALAAAAEARAPAPADGSELARGPSGAAGADGSGARPDREAAA